jgi:hypothetical protein
MSTTRKDVGGAACHEHGAVFASAARVPLTSVASVVEMTGDFTLTLPVMLDVEIGTSRGLSYGTIYTTKLLRRGTDIDRVPSADPFQDLTAADAMRRFPAPLAAANGPSGLPGVPAAGHPALGSCFRPIAFGGHAWDAAQAAAREPGAVLSWVHSVPSHSIFVALRRSPADVG